jgi:hypothetical protein
VAVLHLLEEEVAVQALSEQPALHVGERHDHRVDRRIRAQLVERQQRNASFVEGAGACRPPPIR